MPEQARIAELREFLATYRIDDPLAEGAVMTAYKTFDRDLYAFLLWGFERDLYVDRVFSDADLHLREALSDLSAANFCALSALYKPAMMSLRSSVENFVKFSLAQQGIPIDDTKSTYELNERFKLAFSADPPPVKYFSGTVLTIYSDLCQYVHSANINFMNQSVAFAQMLRVDSDKAADGIGRLHLSCRAFSAVLLRLHGAPSRIHHRHRDFILDRLPRSLKRAVLGS
jgi:hypothetical protein